MDDFLFALALILLANGAAVIGGVVRSRTPADAMLGAQLFATIVVAIVMLLGGAMRIEAAVDAALVLSLLALLAVLAFARRLWGRLRAPAGDDDEC